ncbi:hypothetical protein B0H10DRAFT_2025266, partial [Mycena sp. CBHHK59/15]
YLNNPKWWPYFQNVLGATDGTHINCSPSAEDLHTVQNCKGGISQNCLAVVSFDMHFLFFTVDGMGVQQTRPCIQLLG